VKQQMRAEAEEWAQEQIRQHERKHKEQLQAGAAAAAVAVTATAAATASGVQRSEVAPARTYPEPTIPVPAPVHNPAAVAAIASPAAVNPPSGTVEKQPKEIHAVAAEPADDLVAVTQKEPPVQQANEVAPPADCAELEARPNNGNGEEAAENAGSQSESELGLGLSSLLASSQESLPSAVSSASLISELPDPREDDEEREERTNYKTASERADSSMRQQLEHAHMSPYQHQQRRHHGHGGAF